jgi:hypothetical protein
VGSDSPFSALSPNPDYRFRIEFWAILGCVVLFATLVELVRRRKLKERYSLLWFATSLVLLLLALRRHWLDLLASALGVYYPPSALFLVLVFFLFLILMHFSTVISKLLSENQALAQSVGLLDARVRELEARLRASAPDPRSPNRGADASSDAD